MSSWWDKVIFGIDTDNLAIYTLITCLPFALRLFSVSLPLDVLILFLNPCVVFLDLLLGFCMVDIDYLFVKLNEIILFFTTTVKLFVPGFLLCVVYPASCSFMSSVYYNNK